MVAAGIKLPGYSVWLRAWQVQVGKVKLYLLDSNDAANFPAHRGITSELYGGGPELRLKQELLLGIGGWRLLGALGIKPEVCHLNEGHAAFAVLERARSFMRDTGQPFEVALTVTRAGNLFTTHTAVAAGFDRFAPALIEQYLGDYAEQNSALPLTICWRWAGRTRTTRRSLSTWPIWPSGERRGERREPLAWASEPAPLRAALSALAGGRIPVGHVTNGVHMPTWDSAPADDLWTEVCGKDRWLGTTEKLEQDIRRVSDATSGSFAAPPASRLVEYARERCRGN